jgi:hypothetical protein
MCGYFHRRLPDRARDREMRGDGTVPAFERRARSEARSLAGPPRLSLRLRSGPTRGAPRPPRCAIAWREGPRHALQNGDAVAGRTTVWLSRVTPKPARSTTGRSCRAQPAAGRPHPGADKSRKIGGLVVDAAVPRRLLPPRIADQMHRATSRDESSMGWLVSCVLTTRSTTTGCCRCAPSTSTTGMASGPAWFRSGRRSRARPRTGRPSTPSNDSSRGDNSDPSSVSESHGADYSKSQQ